MLLAAFAAAQAPAGQPEKIVDLLRALSADGISVLYSTDLVPPTLDAPEGLRGEDPMSRLIEALAAHDLVLQAAGPGSFLITRKPASSGLPAKTPPSTAPVPRLDEVSVFGTRYQLGAGTIGEPTTFDARSLEQGGESDSDALNALHSAPGLATNLSARPYIRGAMLEDVLIEYDGIPLADPFHFKTFQGILSVFDTSTVSRAEVFTGGFPVDYGTRSGGVLDLTPRSIASGSEFVVGASTLDYELGSIGKSASRPIEWLFNVRTNADNSRVEPLAGVYGEPRFSDGVGRVRWTASESSAVTLGVILLDDRIALASQAEQASDRSRDLDAWLRWEWTPSADLGGRTAISLGGTERNSGGQLNLPGLAQGSLFSERSFSTRSLRSDWSYAAAPGWRLSFGGEFTRESAELTFIRNEAFSAPIMLGLGQPSTDSIVSNTAPRSFTSGLYASALTRRDAVEIEAGLRLDQQAYQGAGSRAQLSPRLNLRYDLAPRWHAYGSAGEFDQAQRVDEYRAEQNQTTPDPAMRAMHLLVGIAHGDPSAADWRLEAYRNHWSAVSPYYDNLLDPVSLTPQLSPDRVLISPRDADAAGVEVSARRSFGRGIEAWSIYSLSKVADDLAGQYIARSWDQRHAADVGAAWSDERSSISALLGWHSGWPATPLTFLAPGSPGTGYWAAGARNSAHWGSYLSADLRVATSIPVPHGSISFWIDATNVTNRANPCCADLISTGGAQAQGVLDRYWAPRVINVGFSWRVKRPD